MNTTELIGEAVHRLADGKRIGTCIDLLMDVERAEVAYALVDLGRALAPAPALIKRERMRVEDGRLMLDITDAQLDTQRETAGPPADGPINLEAMPPVVVGPFGNTVAPAMAGAVYNAVTGRNRAGRPEIDTAHAGWHWFENLHGLPVFDEQGAVGDLDTMVLNPKTLACVSLTTRDERDNLFSFPGKAIRMVTRGEQSIVLELMNPPPYSVSLNS